METVRVKSKNKRKMRKKHSNVQKKDELSALDKDGKKSACSRCQAKSKAKEHEDHGSCATETVSRVELRTSSPRMQMRMR